MSLYTNIVTLATFKAYLKDVGSDTTYTGQLQAHIDAATDWITNHCGWDFSAASVTRRFFGTDLMAKELKGRGWGAITALSVYDRDNAVVTGVSTSDFYLVDSLLLCKNGGRFYSWYRYEFTISVSQSIPDVVALVCCEIAYDSLEKSRLGTGSLGKETDFSNVLGQSSLRYQPDQALRDRWAQMLAPYTYNFG